MCIRDSPSFVFPAVQLFPLEVTLQVIFPKSETSSDLIAHSIGDKKTLAPAPHSKKKSSALNILSDLQAEQSSGVVPFFGPDSDSSVFWVDLVYPDNIFGEVQTPFSSLKPRLFLKAEPENRVS